MKTMQRITQQTIWDVFWWGVDYGQLLMEEERETEELFDAAVGYIGTRKYNKPSHPVRRRQLHSEKWFNAKRSGYEKFLDIYTGMYAPESEATSSKQKELF
jgi:hypothetical protein